MFSRPIRQQRQKGAISVLAAAALGVSIIIAALAVDLGHVFWVKRDLQKAADLASLSAVTDLNQATPIAQRIALANGYDTTASSPAVTTGVYTWASGVTSGVFTAPAPVGTAVNAVQVTVGTKVAYFFAYFFLPGTTPAYVTATATAARKEHTATFSADSFLASIDLFHRDQLLASCSNPYPVDLGIAGVVTTLQVCGETPVSASGTDRCDDPPNCSSTKISGWEKRTSTAQVILKLQVPLVGTVKLDVAKMEAALTKIECSSSPRRVTIQAQPQLLTVSIKPIIGPTINVSTPSATPDLPPFEAPFDQNNTQHVRGTLLGGIPLLGVTLGSIGLALDDALAGLGISLGGGDITVSDLICPPPQLVR